MTNKTIIGLAALVSSLCINGCNTYEKDALATAQSAGWQDVTITEKTNSTFGSYILCGKDAAYHIQGTNPEGKPAQATACCGSYLQGCTIRY